MTATTTTTTSPPARSRRPRRLGIDAHTEFVGTLVSELDSAVTRLRAAAQSLTEKPAQGDVDLGDTSGLDGPSNDVLRLVRLLDVIDGPGGPRHLEPVSLPDALAQAAKALDIDLSVRGVAGRGRFLGDAESIRLGAELVLSAFAADDAPVVVGIPNDRLVVIEGAFDLSDERRVWQLRCGRRVLEGENCRVRLIGGKNGYRLEIRALEP
jgi:hypothetical protein